MLINQNIENSKHF